MPRPARIIVADADSKHAQLLAFGFEREGLAAQAVRTADDVKRQVDTGDVAGVVLSLPSAKLAVDALRRLRTNGPHLPVVALGEPANRAEIVAAGATDYLARPAYVRDVVALLRFHGTARATTGVPTAWTGDLSEFAGTLYLVRALATAGRTGVMTIVRGLRRAELRFHEGEVTSAQVGVLHGLGALHQILLWTEGKLDFRSEAVVRRQQIPLSAAELFDDCGRFLREFHDLAPEIGPGSVLVQDMRRVSESVDKIPKEVSPVLRLFDGARLLSDVIEDAPFRVFDTLKITTRLVKLGVLRPHTVTSSAPAALKVDDWMVGSTPATGVPALPMQRRNTEPVGPAPGVPASPPSAVPEHITGEHQQNPKKKRRTSRERPAVKPPVEAAPAPAPAQPGAPATDDWGPLPGAAASIWDVPGFAPVVPAQATTGEIRGMVAPRPEPEHVAAAGKVIAEDLVAPPRTPVPTMVLGTARERVDELSAPIMPVVTIMPASAGGRARSPSIPPQAAPANQAAPRIEIQPSLRAPSAPVLAAPVLPAPVLPAPVLPAPVLPAPPPVQAQEAVPDPVLEPMKTEPTAPTPVLPTFVPPPPPEPLAAQGELEARAPQSTRPSQEIASIVIEADEPPDEAVMTVEHGVIETIPAPAAPILPDEPQVLVALPEVTLAESLAASLSLAEKLAETRAFVPTPAADLPAPTASDFTAPAATPPPPEPPAPARAVLPDIEPEPEPVRRPRRTSIPRPVEPAPFAPVLLPVEPDLAPLRIPLGQNPGVPGRTPVETTDPVTRPRRTTNPRARRSSAPPASTDAQVKKSAGDVADATARAMAFDDIDEEFFSQESKFAEAQPGKVETFDDLEPAGTYRRPQQQTGFWKKLFGVSAPTPQQRRRRPTTQPPPDGSGKKK